MHGLDRPNDGCCILAKSAWQCEQMLNGAIVDSCDECTGPPPPPPPVCVPTDREQGGRAMTHLGGNVADPPYGLRLDGLNSVGQPVTFDLVNVFWYYDGADTLTIWGTVFGGLDVGSSWDSPQEWSVWARYTGFSPSSLSTSTTDTVLVIYDDDEGYTYSGQHRMGSSLDLTLNFRVGSDPRAASIYTAEGWLKSDDGFSERGAQDWIALLKCEPDTPPPPPDPRLTWCCECQGSKTQAMPQCLENLPFDPSWTPCGTLGELICRPVADCADCLCRTNDDCGAGECCTMGSCEATADRCFKCPGDPAFQDCTQLNCNVEIPELLLDGVDLFAALLEDN